MEILSAFLIVLGLAIFEVITSIDNAVVNADVLATMDKKYQKWFLVYGIIIAVFLIRGLLPWLIVWISNPSLGPVNSLFFAFSENPQIKESVEKSAPLILMTGGIFLIFLFLHWLFLEPKRFGFFGEEFFSRQGAWFFATASIVLTLIIWFSLKKDSLLAFTAALGSSLFFIVHGFKEYAAKAEEELVKKKEELSEISKLLYLEVLDASFSIDGVIGAFAFTLSVPLILLGNGLGAFIVREFTIRGVEQIRKYVFLKNGAMYSIFFLGLSMVLRSFGFKIPEITSTLITLFIIGFFFWESKLFSEWFLGGLKGGKEKKLEEIIQLARQKGEITSDDVAKFFYISNSTANRYLNQLVKEGKLKKVGSPSRPKYRIP